MNKLGFRAGDSRLISKGTFGCAYKAEFSPKPEFCNAKECISKVMNGHETNKELYIGELLKQIDPTGQYHCRMIDSGRIDPREFADCNVDGIISNYITYEYGGMSLDVVITKLMQEPDINQRKYEINKILLGIENLFNGLCLFNSYKVFHRDIKTTNIVVSSTPDDKRLVRFIDFGMAKHIPDQEDMNELYTSSITPYLPIDSITSAPLSREIIVNYLLNSYVKTYVYNTVTKREECSADVYEYRCRSPYDLVNSIDLFPLGIVLNTIFIHFNNLIEESVKLSLQELISRMIVFRSCNIISPFDALMRYKQICDQIDYVLTDMEEYSVVPMTPDRSYTPEQYNL